MFISDILDSNKTETKRKDCERQRQRQRQRQRDRNRERECVEPSATNEKTQLLVLAAY